MNINSCKREESSGHCLGTWNDGSRSLGCRNGIQVPFCCKWESYPSRGPSKLRQERNKTRPEMERNARVFWIHCTGTRCRRGPQGPWQEHLQAQSSPLCFILSRIWTLQSFPKVCYDPIWWERGKTLMNTTRVQRTKKVTARCASPVVRINAMQGTQVQPWSGK